MSNIDDDPFLKELTRCFEATSGEPPAGNYICSLVHVQGETKEWNGVTYALVKPAFVIVEGEHKDWWVEDCFWIPPEPKKEADFWTLRRFAKLASCLTGREVKTMEEATAIIVNDAQSPPAEFNLVNLRVYKYGSKRAGRQRQGIDYLSGRPANSDGETLSRSRSTETPLGEN